MKRALLVVLKLFGLALVFVLGLVSALLLHVDFAAPRAFAVARVNAMLATSFKGKIVILNLDSLRLTGIKGGDADVFDPEGVKVIHVEGLSARLSAWGLLRSLVGGKDLDVGLSELRIRSADILLIQDEDGEIGLVRAFDSPEPEPETQEPSPGTNIRIADIRVDNAHVHAELAAIPRLDANLAGLTGAFVSTSKATEITVDGLDITSEGIQGLSPSGHFNGFARLPAEGDSDRQRIEAKYEGKLGDIRVSAIANVDGDEVHAKLDVSETSAESIRAIAPTQINLQTSVSAHAEVDGTLPHLTARLEAQIGEGEVELLGSATLPEEPENVLHAMVDVSARNIDLSVIDPGLPGSRLTADLSANVRSLPGGKIDGWLHLRNQIGEIAGQRIPEAEVRAEVTEQSVRGAAHIAEPGAPISVLFAVEPRAGAKAPTLVSFEANASIPRLDRFERSEPIGRGSAHLWTKGLLDLDGNRVRARAQLEAAGLDVTSVQLGHGFVSASADGPLTSPDFAADVRGVGMRAGGYGFPSVTGSAKGSLRSLAVTVRLTGDERSPSIHAGARISIGDAIAVRGALVKVLREDVVSTISVAAIDVAGGVVHVDSATIEGLGEPLLVSATIAGPQIKVTAKGADLDLDRIKRLFAREEDIRGHLAFDVDANMTGRTSSGRVEVHGWGLASRGVEDAKLDVALSLEKGALNGNVVVALEGVGRVELVAADVKPTGGVTTAAAWLGATGSLSVDGNVDLAAALRHVPRNVDQVAMAAGKLTIRAKASRASARAKPVVEIETSSEGLALVGSQGIIELPGGLLVPAPEPWRALGFDGTVKASLDNAGKTTVTASVRDAVGKLVSAEIRSELPFEKLGLDPERWRAELSRLSVEGSLEVPRRSLDPMPRELGTMPLAGEIAAKASFSGTAAAPKVELHAIGTNIGPLDTASCTRTFDVDVRLAYDGKQAELELEAASEGAKVLKADAQASFDLAALFSKKNEKKELDWDGSANLALDRFPLDVAEAFVGEAVGGTATGKVMVRDLHRDASLEGKIALDRISIGGAVYPTAKAEVTLKGGAFHALARVDQSDGYAEVKADGTLAWGAELAPSFDFVAPVDVAVRAKNFRALVVRPFLQETLTDLDGRVDADTKIRIEKGGTDGRMEGAIALREGTFGVPQLGETFHALKGNIVIKPWGTVRFDDFSAEGPTGKVTASAEAVVDGITFRKATAKFHIERDEALPIAVEGVPMGRAYGDIKVKAKLAKDGKKLVIDVDVPMLKVELPQSTGNSPQALAPDETVAIGHRNRDVFSSVLLKKAEEPSEPSELLVHASVKLGKDVEVKRDTTLRAKLRGKTTIVVKDTIRVGGQIRLGGGHVELQGKLFTIDRGSINFVGDDASDPLVVASAHWDAADKTRVFAEFTGKVSEGKLTLRSDPPLSEDEILSLILFGSTDGGVGATAPPGQEASTAAQGAGLAGGVVTQGVNKIISGVTSADITTRVDSSEANSPRPEVAVQITKAVSARLGYKLGVPTPGDNPDRAQLTLDWRFVKNWSLETVVGDQGSTAVDVVWRLRY